MADGGISLKALLLGDAPSAAIAACVGAVSAAAHGALAAAAPPVDWTGLAADIGEKIEEMFDIPLIGVMVGAWQDLRELHDCADPDKHPADETITLPLVDHHLEASFEPHLDVAVTGLPAIRIDFDIAADIELKGVVLRIEGAAIRSMRIGSCQAAATVKCDGAVIFERSTRQLEVPAEIHLPQGIPIDLPWATRVAARP
jgi:hypothetical protein